MRPASARFATIWITVLCLVATFFTFQGLASAQAARGTKRKLPRTTGSQPLVVGTAPAAAPAAPPLTSDTWTGTAGDNNWATAGNWSGGVPTSGSAVTIGTAGANVNLLTGTGNFGTLSLNSGDSLNLSNGVVMNAFGNVTNGGTLNINSSGNFTELVLQGNVTLNGAGTVTMSNNGQNYIFGAASTDVLTNQETIQGAGQIGHNQMTLVNSGTINANQSAGIIVDANGGLTNTGTMEATGGTLTLINNPTITNTGGTISANNNLLAVTSSTINGGNVNLTGTGTLQMNNSTIHGGTLTNSATGTIEILANSNTLGGTINNSAGGTFKVDNGAILNLEAGTYSQLGTLQLNSTGNFTELVLQGNATLSGGTVTMSNNSQNYIFGAAGSTVLTNQETIQGAGQIGHNQMTLVNSGTINANQSAGIIVDANGGLTNTGTMEATGGTLTLINNPTITNTGGTISANNNLLAVTSSTVNGGNVTLTGTGTLQMNNSTIHGGTLTNSATGTIEILANSNTLGGTINNSAGGTFKVDNGAILNLEAGTYSQLGTLQLNSTGNFTELVLQGNATLSGGTVTMSNNSQNYIFGAAGSTVLTNQETIQGAGQIGHNQMTLVNSGTINANQSAGIIVDANGGLTNTGTMEATGGTLTLINNPTITNTGGTISANNNLLAVTSSTINGGSVNLTGTGTLQMNNSTIHGGTLTNSATGTIEILANSNTLGGTINNSAGGTFKVDNGAILNLEAGTYSQLGTLQLNSTGNFTELVIGGNVTLSGGTITMSNNSQNYIFGAAGTDILTNAETIQGAGQIGHSQMGLVNSGTINANASGNIAISVSSSNFNNTGTIEATGGSLTIQGPGTTFFTNDNQTTNTLTGGTYIANGNNIQWAAGSGGINTLAANVTEEGGGQLFNTTNSTNALAGLTSITSAGALTIGGVTFADAGTFSNAGSLTLLPGESFTVGSLTQISGGSLTAGTFVLDANLNLSGATQTITTNAAKLTLAGGTIENANSTNALAGLATNSGTLTIGGTSNNVSTTATTFSNTGTLTINAGDSFTAPKLTQISGTTLSGGTFVLGGNLDLATTGINITTNSSTLTLEGGTIMSGATNALAGLNKNTKTLTLANNANFTTAGSFTNSGTLTVNSGSTFAVNTSGTLTNYNSTTQTLTGGTYSVAGTLSAANLNIVTDAANITLSGTGKLVNATNSANALAGLTTISSTGALTLASNANFTTAGNFTNSGKLTVNSGSTFSVAGTLSNLTSGTLSGGTYTVGGTLQLTGANGGITTNAANLTLTGAAAKILDGTSNELSTFNNNTGSLTLSSSAKLTTASSNFTNSGTVTVSKGTTLTVGGTGHSYTQTAGTTTVDGTLAGSGTTGIVVTGGTVQGAGTLKTNVSSSAAINVGDAGKAGLLSITGTYAQLSSGTLNVSIGGTTVGTQYSQLKVSGTASLGGTLTAALVNAFTPTVGQTFSVLTGSSVSGTFTNTTIAINSSEHFAISYTATSVVLTVVSGPASTGGSSQPLAQMAMAATKPAFGTLQPIRVAGTLRHPIVTSIGKPGIGKPGISRPVLSKPLLLASTGNSKAVLGGRNSRIWEHVPATPSWNRGNGVAVSRIARPVNSAASNLARTGQVRSDLVRPNMLRAENNLRPANNWVGQNHAVPVPVGNWAGVHNPSVMPIRIMKPVLPKIR